MRESTRGRRCKECPHSGNLETNFFLFIRATIRTVERRTFYEESLIRPIGSVTGLR